jgi:hypothetical protein
MSEFGSVGVDGDTPAHRVGRKTRTWDDRAINDVRLNGLASVKGHAERHGVALWRRATWAAAEPTRSRQVGRNGAKPRARTTPRTRGAWIGSVLTAMFHQTGNHIPKVAEQSRRPLYEDGAGSEPARCHHTCGRAIRRVH